jgi:hypothetical protein
MVTLSSIVASQALQRQCPWQQLKIKAVKGKLHYFYKKLQRFDNHSYFAAIRSYYKTFGAPGVGKSY